MKHTLERTSPKGEDFVGRCVNCGLTDLPGSAIWEECSKSLLEAIDPYFDEGFMDEGSGLSQNQINEFLYKK